MTAARVFAVDDGTVQLIDGRRVFDVDASDPLATAARPRDVPSPPGAVVTRLATISDLHIGEDGFGILPKVREPRGRHREHFTVRATRAAIAEAVAWGAEMVIVKGDITWSARPGQWERACEVFADAPVPIVAAVGNHDTVARGQDGRPWLEQAGIETIVDMECPVAAVDLPGVRIVLGHPTSHGHGPAHMAPRIRDELIDAVDHAPIGAGAVVMLHHHPDRFPVRTRYPEGLVLRDANPLFRGLAALARPPALLTCGHTHRHRRYRRHGITVSEVGSTKDYPGVWAGYAVHEGGIRQVVRRIAEPSVVEWTDRTKRACLALWGWWTPGLLDWRCFSLPWP